MPAKWVKTKDGTPVLESHCDFCTEEAPFIQKFRETVTCRCGKHWREWRAEKEAKKCPNA